MHQAVYQVLRIQTCWSHQFEICLWSRLTLKETKNHQHTCVYCRRNNWTHHSSRIHHNYIQTIFLSKFPRSFLSQCFRKRIPYLTQIRTISNYIQFHRSQNNIPNQKVDTPFCLQYSSSVQQSSFLTASAGQLGLGTIADIEEVTTTRLTPASFAALSTLIVPLTAGSNSSL